MKKQLTKRLLSMTLAIAMICTLLTFGAMTVSAATLNPEATTWLQAVTLTDKTGADSNGKGTIGGTLPTPGTNNSLVYKIVADSAAVTALALADDSVLAATDWKSFVAGDITIGTNAADSNDKIIVVAEIVTDTRVAVKYGTITIAGIANEPADTSVKPAITEINYYYDEYIVVNGDGRQIMYALGKDAAAITGKLDKAKWYPLFSNYVDISAYIPKTNKTYAIAFKYLDSKAETANVEVVSLTARPDAKNLKTVAKEFGTKFTLTDGVEFKIGVMDYYAEMSIPTGATEAEKKEYQDELTEAFGNPDLYPAGASGVMRYSPTDDKPASLDVKFKIPAQPKAPKYDKMEIKDGKKETDPAFISGLTDKMEVFLGYDNDDKEVWSKVSKDMTVENFNKLFADKTKSDGTGKVLSADGKSYEFKVRFFADKKTASAKATMSLDKTKYDTAAGGAGTTTYTAGSYYKVEETVTATSVKTTKYVKADGTLSDNIQDIGALIGTAITLPESTTSTYEVIKATAYAAGTGNNKSIIVTTHGEDILDNSTSMNPTDGKITITPDANYNVADQGLGVAFNSISPAAQLGATGTAAEKLAASKFQMARINGTDTRKAIILEHSTHVDQVPANDLWLVYGYNGTGKETAKTAAAWFTAIAGNTDALKAKYTGLYRISDDGTDVANKFMGYLYAAGEYTYVFDFHDGSFQYITVEVKPVVANIVGLTDGATPPVQMVTATLDTTATNTASSQTFKLTGAVAADKNKFVDNLANGKVNFIIDFPGAIPINNQTGDNAKPVADFFEGKVTPLAVENFYNLVVQAAVKAGVEITNDSVITIEQKNPVLVDAKWLVGNTTINTTTGVKVSAPSLSGFANDSLTFLALDKDKYGANSKTITFNIYSGDQKGDTAGTLKTGAAEKLILTITFDASALTVGAQQ